MAINEKVVVEDTTKNDLNSSTSTNTSTNTNTNTNGIESNIENNSYLYNSGLQNIFDDYQNSIAKLETSKQQDIEDAYFVKEMQKQYLGEYASNNDIFDVSGQLLDIYSGYQNNITDINTYYSDLEYNLQQAYDESVTTQGQEQAFGEISYNLKTGLIPDGMTEVEYLTSVRDQLGETNYWALMQEYKGIEMTTNVNNALGKFGDYETQEEYDAYVDELLENGGINKTQAEYLKNQYSIDGLLDFKLDSSYGPNGLDGSYLESDASNVVKNGKVYSSSKGQYLLETNNVVYSGDGNFDDIKKDSEGKGYNTPFASGNLWWVQNTDGSFTQYAIGTNPNEITNQSVFDKESSNYEGIHEVLNGKSGVINNNYYTYDEEKDTYSLYLNVDLYSKGLSIGNEKGSMIINGVKYEFDGNGDRIADTKQFKIGFSDKGAGLSSSHKPTYENMSNLDGLAGDVVKEMAKIYFDGDDKALFNEVFKDHPQDKAHTYVVALNGKYYTVNDGQIYELRKS